MADLLLALDQGTTSSRAIVFDGTGSRLSCAQREHPQSFPRPGWVEHDPEAIWSTLLGSATEAVRAAGIGASDIAAIGIANQRETIVVWRSDTGRAVAPAIVWQDRRTADLCHRLAADGVEPDVTARTGLLLDPYFSATKIAWVLDHVPGIRAEAEAGRALAGTIDTYLLWRLTNGAVHATDTSNASRTLLMNLDTCDWDDEMLRLFRVPRQLLPAIVPTIGLAGTCAEEHLGRPLPICAMAGDQQAATFGQACFEPGTAKNTYGTGSFLLLNTGTKRQRSTNRLLETIAWRDAAGTTFALEGSVFCAGSAVQWLRDQLGIVASAPEVEALARTVPDAAGVHFVPAFTGLGAPYWAADARAAILGLTRGSGRGHIARACLEAAAFQTRGVTDAMAADCGSPITVLRVDGGMSRSDLMLEVQADVLGVPVERPRETETTALGAALMAGLGAGMYSDTTGAAGAWRLDRRFEPRMSPDERESMYDAWRRAVAGVLAYSGIER